MVKFDGADSIDEGGGMFSWFDKDGVVGNGVLGLVNMGVEGEAIDAFFIVVDIRGELWSGWILLGRKGHGEFLLSWRVLILLVADWNSASRSGAWRSSSGIHLSCDGEYPFQHTRYCFFFHQPKVCSWSILSTSHSSSPSMMSGGGSRKLGPC